MKREIRLTADGSKTIYLPEMDETYHSSHGALQEARHVFIKNGLQQLIEKKEVSIFEMGFGTGLNALLSFFEAEDKAQKIKYVGIEAFPVELDLINQLDYATYLDAHFDQFFKKLHAIDWNVEHKITNHFSFQKVQARIEDYQPSVNQFDIVYYDAFGPRAQEEMWAVEILAKMYDLLKPGGMMVTYCAKGQFKRDLKELGFSVQSLPGPPGKREMTRAYKLS